MSDLGIVHRHGVLTVDHDEPLAPPLPTHVPTVAGFEEETVRVVEETLGPKVDTGIVDAVYGKR